MYINPLKSSNNSYLQMLGFRMYNNETGRFTTPDLLWSAFPAHTPYHYAYNSPMTYRDQTWLAPEKEKEREELMSDQENRIVTDEVVVIGQKEETNMGGVDLSMLTKNRQVGDRLSKKGSAPDDLGEGGSNGGFSLNINFSDFGSSDPGHTGSGSMFEGVGLSNSGPPNMGSGGGTISPGYVLTKYINEPKKWDFKTKFTALVKENIYSTLNEISRNTSNEVGFFLRYDSQKSKIFAYFFIGKSEELWLDLNINPYQKVIISVNQMIIGFVHKHNVSDYFSQQDGKAIKDFSLGKFPWTKIPSSIENQDAKIMDRLFFALLHPNGKDILSYNYMNSTNNLQTLYYIIRTKIYYNSVTILNFNRSGFDFHNNIK